MRDRRLEALLRRAEESVAARRAHLEMAETEPPSAAWFGRMGAVLGEIEERGGEVSVEDLREIGIRHGYDPRGMGGFLSGLSPSLERDSPGPPGPQAHRTGEEASGPLAGSVREGKVGSGPSGQASDARLGP